MSQREKSASKRQVVKLAFLKVVNILEKAETFEVSRYKSSVQTRRRYIKAHLLLRFV